MIVKLEFKGKNLWKIKNIKNRRYYFINFSFTNKCNIIYKSSFTSSMVTNDSYATLGLLISGMFQFGALIYGLVLLLIVGIEYFLISFIIKLCKKLQGLK